jgi:predicted permease
MRWDRWFYVVPLRLRSLFRSTTVERELDEELQYHLQRQIDLNLERGMSPGQARHAALRAMGGLEQHKELMRDHRRVQFADILSRDLRYGLRVLRRSPIFAAVAILSLTLGIGANAAIFQLIDAVRLRSLPIANPGELVEVRAEGVDGFGISSGFAAQATFPLWEQFRAQQTAFATMFAWGNTIFLAGRGSEAVGARGLWVSGDFFRALGIPPARGRLLTAADDRPGCGAGPAVISHAFWQTYFGGGESVVGRTLTLLEQPFTVVGVTPPAFTGLEIGQTFDVAVPLCSAALFGDSLERRDLWWLSVMGRLKPDWTRARASGQLRALSPGVLEATVPPSGYGADLLERYRSFRFEAVPAGRGISRLRDAHGTSLSLLLGLTGLVLLITCGNLATLMLARASAREREVAVRAAIGASRPRLVSQMMIESLLVAVAGAALAVPAAVWSGRALVAVLDTPANPIVLTLAADWRMIAFVGAIPRWRRSCLDCCPRFACRSSIPWSPCATDRAA